MLAEVRTKYDIDNWTYEEFLAFLLMYAAYSDYKIVEEELEAIDIAVGKEHEQRAKKIMDKLNDAERIDLILSFEQKYFPNKEDQEKLFGDMRRIFLADGDFHALEKTTLMYLKKLF